MKIISKILCAVSTASMILLAGCNTFGGNNGQDGQYPQYGQWNGPTHPRHHAYCQKPGAQCNRYYNNNSHGNKTYYNKSSYGKPYYNNSWNGQPYDSY